MTVRQKQNRIHSAAKVLFFLCLAGISFAAGGEIILRLFYFGPDALVHFRRYEPVVTVDPWHLVLSDNPRIAVEPRPDYEWYYLGKKVRTNRLGIVDAREALPKSEESGTIVMLGDSYMEGSGVEMTERVSAQLERLLQPHGNYAVINMALTNSVLESQIERLKQTVIPAYNPDLVLVSFLPDRLSSTVLPPAVWQRRAEDGSRIYPFWKISFFLFVIHDYLQNVEGFTQRLLEPLRLRINRPGKAKEEGPSLSASPAQTAEAERAERLVDELCDLGERYGFKTVLVPISLMKDFQNPERLRDWRDWMQTIARKRGLTVIDTLPLFRQEDVRTCILWLMNRHPNAYANRIFARGIYQGLRDASLVS